MFLYSWCRDLQIGLTPPPPNVFLSHEQHFCDTFHKTTMTNIQILTWIFFIRYVRFQCRWLELTRTRNNGIQGTQSFFSINLITRKKTIKNNKHEIDYLHLLYTFDPNWPDSRISSLFCYLVSGHCYPVSGQWPDSRYLAGRISGATLVDIM